MTTIVPVLVAMVTALCMAGLAGAAAEPVRDNAHCSGAGRDVHVECPTAAHSLSLPAAALPPAETLFVPGHGVRVAVAATSQTPEKAVVLLLAARSPPRAP